MRILVVEDEVGIADSLDRGLTADGFAVDIARNGVDGLWMAQNNPYAAIVLDIMLPGLNGFLIARQLRDDKIWTPILMLTAKDGELDEAEALETGADDYLRKPFSYVVLLARLRALIRRSGNTPVTDVLQVADVTVDVNLRQVECGGNSVELSPRAVAVLEYLIRNVDRVVTKDEILRNVWDHAFEGDPNIVEVYISRIRSVIDSDRSRPLIETVRGVGYRLRSNQ